MMYKRHLTACFTGLLMLLLQGCSGSGEAKFYGKLAGEPFNPNKTVFAYSVTKDAAGELLAQPYMIIVMTSFAFNPTKDFSKFSPERLGSMRDKLLRSHALIIRVVLPPAPESSNGLSFSSATHPDRDPQGQGKARHRVQIGTREKVTTQRVAVSTFLQLSIDSNAPTGDPPMLEGRVLLERIDPLNPSGGQPVSSSESAQSVNGRFKAPIFSQEQTEQNMRLLLDVPLDPPEPVEGQEEKFQIIDLFYPIPASS